MINVTNKSRKVTVSICTAREDVLANDGTLHLHHCRQAAQSVLDNDDDVNDSRSSFSVERRNT